ncbi:hypothetical protein ACIRPR_06390 [Streptomyces griseoflavus]|uniref:hypothetical protein n=1 Tax=Streptomyces griseoflavus TaxID=35619 RepID=UPI0038274AA7
MTLAYGALVLLPALSAGALFSRWYVAPTGAHRAPRALEDTVTLEDLLRPTTHGVNDLAYCPAEKRETLHAFGTGTRTCWTCRTETDTAVPRG